MINPTVPSDWPEYGATVRLTRYGTGSTLVGDHADPEFVVVGTVIASPRSGAESLIVATEHDAEHEQHDLADPPTWSITPGYVMLTPAILWQWSIDPEPSVGQFAVITAVVDTKHVHPQVIAAAMRAILQGLGCELISHNWAPDPDTVADCADVPRVAVLDIAP